MSLTAYPSSVAVDATALLVYKGQPNVSVEWDITSGSGTLTPQSAGTDERGIAAAVFAPSLTGAVTVSVTHG